MFLALRWLLCAVVALAAWPAGAAGQQPLVPDPGVREVAVLGSTFVWVRDEGSREVLMQRQGGGVRRVPGAPAARFYRDIDLGRGFDGRIVLTYQRCASGSRCVVRVDDLHGRRARVRGLGRPGCEPAGTPALWRVAWGLLCERESRLDERRSGVYVRVGGGRPLRLRPPRDALRFGVVQTRHVDLRGRRVAYVLADVYSYVVSQDAGGGDRHAFLAGASEGDADERVAGLGAGAGRSVFSLTLSLHAGDPLQARIARLDGRCLELQRLLSPPGSEEYPAVDLAADHRRLLLAVPGTGIVAREFAPESPC